MRALAPFLLLAACAAPPPPRGLGADLRLAPALLAAPIAPDAQGRCWGRNTEPAVIRTVTVQEQATPPVLAPDGTVAVPASFRSTVRQQIARERREVAFETLCPPAFTPDLVASLQRALAARGFYDGPATGVLDTATGRAVQDFQRARGPDSPLLSLASARELGLVALSPEELGRL